MNLASHDLSEKGILAVNGPPGTGKTTLLRDIVAGVVTSRAQELCKFDDPESAFINSGLRLKAGGGFTHLYSMDNRLRGHEIIVASSNNRAVENVTAELPVAQALAADAAEIRYFKTVSDALTGRDTWGTISAVLGNAKNRSEFRQAFWWDDDTGLRRYFLTAVGQPQFIVEQTPEGPKQRRPEVVVQESPPVDHNDALRRWRQAREHFRKVSKSAALSLSELQQAYDLAKTVGERRASIAGIDQEILAMEAHLPKLRVVLELATEKRDRQQAVVATISAALDSLSTARPGFFKRIFGSSTYNSWKADHQDRTERLATANAHWRVLSDTFAAKLSESARADADLQKLRVSKKLLSEELDNASERYQALEQMRPGTFISGRFFELSHEAKQKAAPWLDEASARLRHEVFAAAMALHKAFVDAAAKPIRHNLSALMDGFGSRSLESPEKDSMIPDLWATLFLIVPVISTTFASVSRMFGRVPAESFGWLLIDEDRPCRRQPWERSLGPNGLSSSAILCRSNPSSPSPTG